MEALLKTLQEGIATYKKLFDTLTNAINYTHNITKEAEVKLKAALDKEAQNVLESANLSSREAKVAKIENIVKIEADSQVALKENKILLDRLDQERSAFRKEATSKLREIAQKEHKLADDNLLLTKGWEALRAKEASYKSEIEEKIRKQFK